VEPWQSVQLVVSDPQYRGEGANMSKWGAIIF
jgi:hypothetical protein